MNVSNLKTIFGGCITATNIIRDQIEDRNDVAVWYLSAGEVPVTPAAIVDEYGREYTREEFLQMLEECPIRFTDSCGERFC